jgi:signal transduction histidine kinase
MRSLLGVPVISHGRTIGNLYLTDKIAQPEFTEVDEEMVRTFAAHAAAAVETGKLQDRLRGLAVLQERERIGMDLHDGIIQSIYAVGLGLDGAAEDVVADPEAARGAINQAIEQLDAVIRDVRSYILDLRPAHLTDDLGESLRNLATDFRANSLASVTVDIQPGLPVLSMGDRLALFHIAHEALVNARKHAQATALHLTLRPLSGGVRLEVRDNGSGFDPSLEMPEGHHGLRNMASRAAAAGGTLHVESAPERGTSVRIDLPLGDAHDTHPDPDRR